MKIYKDQHTELLYVGATTYPAGSLQLEILSDNKIRLINLLSKTNDPIFSGNVTDIINKENKSYDNLTDFINKCKDFFVNASSNGEALTELESKVDETIIELGALEDRVDNLGVEANLEPLNVEVAQLRSDLSKKSSYKGVATPSTNPGTPDGPVFYLAGSKGVYSNFGGYTHNGEQLVVLSNATGAWTASQTEGLGIQTKTVVDNTAIDVMIRSANPAFKFSGYVDTTTATPAYSKNKAYIALEDGTIFGLTGVKKGQLIYDTGTTFKKMFIPTRTNLPQSVNIYDNTKPLLDGYYSTGGVFFASSENQNTDLIDVSEFEYIFILLLEQGKYHGKMLR